MDAVPEPPVDPANLNQERSDPMEVDDDNAEMLNEHDQLIGALQKCHDNVEK